MDLPEEYVVQKFYQLAGYPKYVKSTNTYMGGCPICREGKSWGRKSRLYYLPKDNVICCHNCGWYGDPIKWICEVDTCTFKEIILEIKQGAYGADFIENYLSREKSNLITRDIPDIPKDSINLFDDTQVEYYRSNKHVQHALELVKRRRLDKAINKPKTYHPHQQAEGKQYRKLVTFRIGSEVQRRK